MQPLWRRSILLLAAVQVVGVALVVGLLFVLLTMHLTERYTQQSVSGQVQDLLTTVESATQIACFTKDQALAAEIVNGVANNQVVFKVAIASGNEILAERDKASSSPESLRKAQAGRITRSIASPFDPQEIVGEILIDPDPAIIRSQVREYGGFVAMLLGLQLLVVIGAVLAGVLFWIVRPIKRMSDKLHGMDADSIEPLPVPPGQESSEIGRLAHDINQLGQRLISSRDKEHLLRLQREIGERKYHAIFENADSGIFVIDSHTALESGNHAFYRQLNLPEHARDEGTLRLAELAWRHPEALITLVERCLIRNTPVSEDFEYALDGRNVRWFNVAFTPIGHQLIQGLMTDISRHKQAEWSAQQEAITDALTGLFNRNGFLEKLEQEIRACHNAPDSGFSVFLLDLDGFKRINESLGLASGDQILTITAHRLRSCLKNNDIIARLGGDSFGILLRAKPTEKLAANVGTRIVAALRNLFEIGKTQIQLGASLGITFFPSDGTDPPLLLRNAELALNHARLGGGNRFSFYDVLMARNAEHRNQLENDLRLAIRRNELQIYFQPIIDLSERRVAGAEALVRWKHPQRGMVQPDAFIPLAEETGSIIDIGLWMLEAACQQLARWQAQGCDHTLSLNISARQIPDSLLPDNLSETVNRYGVNPDNLVIEITESAFLGDYSSAQLWLNAVHERGFRIYLDDFGTGYSSLSYLKRFPIDVLKIDKSFVRDMSDDNNDRALVEAIIHMAGSLGLTVVAEGVESLHQMQRLESMGCRYVQGYYFSKPVPAEEFDATKNSIQALLA